ncbi:phosphonatase-like hydrolase [Myroides odoratimimus]|uniref:Phosphonatase-like hydrolase n=1 Tax=Myroides odoratimimus CIP 101113 TaxID=883154 RepID=A0AAV3F1X4_9FLAO|nr:phosphonatase-like hydrolase [Myroides odoratimimus]EHO10939.1 phosphonatase-like hydrolase [Myroides odoratimimus CIP 101113]
MKEIQMVVFDMAGTTVNEDNLVYKTVCDSINQMGYEVTLEQTLQYGAGKEKRQAIKDILMTCTTEQNIDQQANLIFKNFKKHLEDAYNIYPIQTYEGIQSLFDLLKSKGIKVVLNTGYDSKTANKLLNKLNWKVGHTVDALITADDVEIGRPSPEMINKAMRQFNIIDAKYVLKAGDSIIDIEEGHNANCGYVVGVLTGAQNRELLKTANPTHIVEKLTDIREWI